MHHLKSSQARPLLILALLGTLGVTALLPSCDQGACGAVGCGEPMATIHLVLPAATATTFPLAVTACLGADCHTATMPAPTGANAQSSFIETSSDGPTVSGVLSPTAAGTFSLNLAWLPFGLGDGRNGDHYTVKVVDSGGGTVASFDKKATYSTTYPNGTACAPACKSVVYE
jgi:hypothetical protein